VKDDAILRRRRQVWGIELDEAALTRRAFQERRPRRIRQFADELR